jgi:DNA-directed RNA polymerase specialized sigma24 family protein
MEHDATLPDDALANLDASAAPPHVRRLAAELLPAFYQQLRRIAHRTRAWGSPGRSWMRPTSYGLRRLPCTLSNLADLSVQTDEGLLALNEALGRLAVTDPRLADVVECRFFGRYGEEDTARALGTSLRTVQRDWLKARAWLFRELGGSVS